MRDLCIDARMAFSSGIGTYIRELLPFLQSAFRLILLVDRPWREGCEQILFNAPIYSVQEQIQYPFKIPPCDLFWSPHYNVPLLPIRAKKRIVTIHDACHFVFGSFAEKTYAKWVMGKALQSHRAITVSQFSKKEIEKRFGPTHLTVIPIGVNRERFSPQPPSESVRQKMGLPPKFALFVGSHKPHKNLQRLRRVPLKDLELV
ncbi:MAG: glycosyltransferase family 1 protein, partial [Verrucomicrobia bacterium]|nr:glycosyltransferase family 1 protein [Verrucomicrobiota bacterium]